jgi:transcriptional regulator with XRE-family HTH domain
MPATERILDRANRRGREDLALIGREIRDARMALGLSQEFVARAAAISASSLSRIEHGRYISARHVLLVRLCAVVGMDLSSRPYPGGPPIRDRAHLDLLDRLRQRIAPSLRWLTEVPLLLSNDRRAWDAMIASRDRRVGVEAEQNLRDIQAVQRRVALKKRDSSIDAVILLVRDSRWNRHVLREWRELLGAAYPGDGRKALADLGAGRLPAEDVLIVI